MLVTCGCPGADPAVRLQLGACGDVGDCGEYGEHGERDEHGEHGERDEYGEYGEHGERDEYGEYGERDEYGEYGCRSTEPASADGPSARAVCAARAGRCRGCRADGRADADRLYGRRRLRRRRHGRG
ncbi:hypothetical protein GCM10022384_21520 [Streptomyces marokkonensis]|uniref:Uncharacterized protein n=1 Tax=Streptomyces marokkonensis TaxID=324855 RepID=A0ABP7PRJ2_9ACTN